MVSTEPDQADHRAELSVILTLPRRRPGMVAQRLKLHYENRLPQREIARVCGIGNDTVAGCLRRARKAGLVWPLPGSADEALE